MTGIIMRGIEQSSFSVWGFYQARARRIVPALIVLCAFLLLAGWFFLSPLEFMRLGKHAFGSLTFFSNFMYFTEAGYFDVASNKKWLLHTWSLSAEWQFYLLYPLVLLILSRIVRVAHIKWLIVAGTIAGYLFGVIVTERWPSQAYFLLHSRAWEMMLGGVAYLLPFKLTSTSRRFTELTGLLLIVGSILLISEDNPWPGAAAFFPVIGTFLVIQAQNNNSFWSSNPVMQSLGTWSYSIYLWHWPVYVATGYFGVGGWYIYAGIGLSVLLGYVSYRFIESGWGGRRPGDSGKHTAVLSPLPMFLGISALCLTAYIQPRYFYSIPDAFFDAVLVDSETNDYNAYTWSTHDELDKKNEFADVNYKVLVIGDSQAGDMLNILSAAHLSGKVDIASRKVLTRCGVFMVGDDMLAEVIAKQLSISVDKALEHKRFQNCSEQIERVRADALVREADIIIVSMNWRNNLLPFTFESIKNIKALNLDAQVYVAGNKSFNLPVPELIYAAHYANEPFSDYAFQNIANNQEVDVVMQDQAFVETRQSLAFHFIPLIDYLCADNVCPVVNTANKPLYYDNNHLTPEGAKYFADKLKSARIFESEIFAQ